MPTSRWYSGSGIYRHVRLKALDAVHVDLWGVYCTSVLRSATEGAVQIETKVKNDDRETRQVKLLTEIFSNKGEKVGTATETLRIEPNTASVFKQSITVKNPVLWDIDSPVLYTAVTRVKSGSYIDETKTDFGFRTMEWDRQKGFFLNGKNMKLKGGNLHHDGGIIVGAAVPERLWEMRLRRMKDIGCNFVRTAHNPPAPEFLDLCDRLGLLVMDEAFDSWRFRYYEQYYNEWWKIDLQSMLQRDRNHPSIILWSVGNEVGDDQKTASGAAALEQMANFVREYEPSRKVTVVMYPNKDDYNTYGFADKVDIAGHNYNEPYYEIDKQKYPHRLMLGTETYLYYRGYAGDDMHFESKRHTWQDVLEHDWVVGWTLWPGIDYLGETNRFKLKGWPTGLLDASGKEKTIAGLYRAFWKTSPQLEIAVLDDCLDIEQGLVNWSSPKMASHWNFPHYADQLIRVHTFTNCDTVELKINKRSLGKRALADFNNSTIEWNVPYAAGTLKATGYKDGKEVIVKELRTAGEPAAISLNSVYPSVNADGQDVAIVEVFLKDKNGEIVQHDNRIVSFTVSANGELLGVDNGDLRIEKRAKDTISTYFGRCMLIVRAGNQAGEIRISATSEGLHACEITIPVTK
jgi:beta-galactosidase